MFSFDPQSYGPVFAPLLGGDRLCELGPGRPRGSAADVEAALVRADLFPAAVLSRPLANCCRAAVWLLYDHFDRSHALSQEIDQQAGSYWHGILHRREPDFSNAKYWFRQVGRHPVFEPLQRAACDLAAGMPHDQAADYLLTQPSWDPFRFIDLCEAALAGKSTSGELCKQIQRLEWELLFDDCFRGALGK